MLQRTAFLLLCAVGAVWGKYSVWMYYSDNSCTTPVEIYATVDSQCTAFDCADYGGGETGSFQANCSDSLPTAPSSWLEYDTYFSANCSGSPDTAIMLLPEACANLGILGSEKAVCSGGNVTYSQCTDDTACRTCTSITLPVGCQSDGGFSVQWRCPPPPPPPPPFCVQLWTNTNQCKGQPYSQVTGQHGKVFELPLDQNYVLYGSDTISGSEVILDCVNPNTNTKARVPMPSSCHYFPPNTLPCQETSITITVSTGACNGGTSPYRAFIPINQE